AAQIAYRERARRGRSGVAGCSIRLQRRKDPVAKNAAPNRKLTAVSTISIHSPFPGGRFRVQRKARFRLHAAVDDSGRILTDCRTVLESVARTSTRDPHIFQVRMAIDEEIAIARVFVLADLA